MRRKVAVMLVLLIVFVYVGGTEMNVSAADMEYSMDDLRDIVGLPRHKSQSYALEVIEMADKIGAIETEDEMNELIAKFGLTKVASTGYDEVKESLSSAQEYLKSAIGNGLSADVVFYAINQVEYFVNQSKLYYTSKLNVTYEYGKDTGLGIFQDENEVKQFIEKYNEEYVNDSFIVGHIGNGLKPYVENIWKLSKVFGTVKTTDGEVEYNCIAIRNIMQNNVNVLSQFNGEVEKVETGKNGLFKITIKHGEYAKTVYDNISNTSLANGDKLKQYDKIGEIESGVECELQLIVDGIIVNPLLIYGAEGIYALYELQSENPGTTYETEFIEKVKNEPSEESDIYNGDYAKLDESAGHLESEPITYGTSFYDNNSINE